jgi:hypothetical protein
MSTNNFDQNSFINLFPEIVDNDNLKILDIWNSFRVQVVPDNFNTDAYIEYTPQAADNLYSLANTFYGTVKLWWLIPLVNDAEDPFDFLKNVMDKSGTIKVLKSNYASSIIFTMGRTKNIKDKK